MKKRLKYKKSIKSKKPLWLGPLIITLILLSLCGVGFVNLNRFLSITRPIPANVMIVEGWVPDRVLVTAANTFTHDQYQLLISTGGPIPQGYYLSEYKSYAAIAAATLKKLGLNKESVISVPARAVRVDRTFASAIMVKEWLAQSRVKMDAINLVTLGPHARRSWLIFKKVLGPAVKVGIIAVPDDTYDTKQWWNSSNGFRTVVDEWVAYVYFKVMGRI